MKIEDLEDPVPTETKPGQIYLIYGSDQQIKIHLWKRKISYQLLVYPTYYEVEQALAHSSYGPLDKSVDALIILPKTYKVIHNRKPKEEDKHSIPNYQKLQVSSRRIVFIIGDPYDNPPELKQFYKKLEGGVFKSLVLDGENRFPLSQKRSLYRLEDGDSDLFESLIESLHTKRGVSRWRSINRNEFYRLFKMIDGGLSPFEKMLFSRSEYACRDLYPWVLPFIHRLNKEKWQYPGELLGLFALWVYRCKALWSEPYQEGLKSLKSTNSGYYLVFNPSLQAKRTFLRYSIYNEDRCKNHNHNKG